MVTEKEYKKIIESFLWELQSTIAALSSEDLNNLPDFVKEFQEIVSGLRDSSTPSEDLVGHAFGIVDEFVHANWDSIMRDGYSLYADSAKEK